MTPHTKYNRKSKPTNRGDALMDPEVNAKAMRHRQMSLPDRFWSQVEKTPTCWLWRGALLASGHGQLSLKGRMRKAHHIALELVGQNPMVAGMLVDHICRVRNCVRPEHLRIVHERVNALENNIGPSAINARKTHCKQGHPLSGDNLAVLLTKGRKLWDGTRRKPVRNRRCLTCDPWAATSKHRIFETHEIGKENGH